MLKPGHFLSLYRTHSDTQIIVTPEGLVSDSTVSFDTLRDDYHQERILACATVADLFDPGDIAVSDIVRMALILKHAHVITTSEYSQLLEGPKGKGYIAGQNARINLVSVWRHEIVRVENEANTQATLSARRILNLIESISALQ